jgi:hypothetical protein
MIEAIIAGQTDPAVLAGLAAELVVHFFRDIVGVVEVSKEALTALPHLLFLRPDSASTAPTSAAATMSCRGVSLGAVVAISDTK